jgi:polyhydroxybutyrate depolymerase
MRLSRGSRLLFASPAALATVLAGFACSSSEGSPPPYPSSPDGAVVLEDGAVVDPPDAGVIAPDTGPASKVNTTSETVTVMGQTRKYELAVPKSYDAGRAYPLIIALHGDGQDGASFHAFLDFDALAGDDAVVAYPTGASDLFTSYDQNADQQLIEATINAVKGKLSIDAAKVWGFGYSKGGFMANEIACRRPGVWKAMAIHAGGAPQEPQGADGFPQCPGVIGLPVLETEGQFDQGIGGDYGAQYWASVNGCGTGRTATAPAPCQASDGCPAGKPVIYCLAPGVSHYPIWGQAAAVSWGFFKSL